MQLGIEVRVWSKGNSASVSAEVARGTVKRFGMGEIAIETRSGVKSYPLEHVAVEKCNDGYNRYQPCRSLKHKYDYGKKFHLYK